MSLCSRYCLGAVWHRVILVPHSVHWGITLAWLWLASAVIRPQPMHEFVLVGVFGWHIAGRGQVGYLRQGSSTWWCCCCAFAVGGGIAFVFEALCCDNDACCQGQIGVCKSLCAFCSWLALMSIFSHCARDGNVVV